MLRGSFRRLNMRKTEAPGTVLRFWLIFFSFLGVGRSSSRGNSLSREDISRGVREGRMPIECPVCEGKTKPIKTRRFSEDLIRRRCVCLVCGVRFNALVRIVVDVDEGSVTAERTL